MRGYRGRLLKHGVIDGILHVMICQLVIERKPEATSLIKIYEQSLVSVVEAHGLNVVDDFAVMAIILLRLFGLFFSFM